MTCLVTAGPSYEPFDEVRRLTNFSTGTLGSQLANSLVEEGHEVILLLGYYCTYQGEQKAQQVIRFTTSEDLHSKLQSFRTSRIGAVFHAAAICDFALDKIWARLPSGEMQELHSRKIPSQLPSLVAELIPTSKIIRFLRPWFPEARLFGWKYQVDGDRAAAISEAKQQITENDTDGCVANGPAYGDGFGFLDRDGTLLHLSSAQSLFGLFAQKLKVS